MQELLEKIEQLKKVLGAMKPKSQQNSLVPAIKPPSIKPISVSPPKAPAAASKMPGIAPASLKDPKKMAEQLTNPRPKKPKVDMLKADEIHYRIHVDGHPVTEPMPLQHIIANHGSVKDIENIPGHKIIPVKPAQSLKMSNNGQWSLRKY